MFIVCLTIFSSILSPLQPVSYVKVHVYCVFDYFLFNLVSTSDGELCESACLLCVWLFSLQSCLHFRRWVTWKCMFIVCLTIFSSILSPLQTVSYVKVHVYCVFDYFLFNIVSTSGGELRKSACLLCVWLFLSWILFPLQDVSYVKVHVYCVFDYFLFNIVSTSDSELHESACLLCVWLFLFNIVKHTSVGELRESTWLYWKQDLTIFKHTINMHIHVTHRLKWRQHWRENSQTSINMHFHVTYRLNWKHVYWSLKIVKHTINMHFT